MRYDDDELLALVRNERRRSIGFGEAESGKLIADRERALRFYNGDVSKDITPMANRSQVVSTDVAEAVETALPDLVEVFLNGDDIATFKAMNAQDEQQAKLESDYVRSVILEENEGFILLNTAFKDALLVKTGLFHWRWEETESEETSEPMPVEAVVAELGAMPEDEQANIEFGEPDEQGQITAIRKVVTCKVRVDPVAPEDFTVGSDTVNLRDATYCAMRDRPRVQDLIARGVDPETARGLKGYTQPDQTISQARDEAGEQTLNRDDATGDLRQVEVRSHFIRLLDEDSNELEIWRIDTDSEETVMLGEPEKVPSIPFGPITPYMNPHRFYGKAVADVLIEIQKIKTTLWRMQLDDGYYSLNQRIGVDVNRSNEFTIPDLLNNVPGHPIRVSGSPAEVLQAVRAGGLGFDVMSAMEQASVMGEQRTGIVRNAQGLKPDTLHDTAKGAIALITAAQKRIRYIARVFAETGIKDMFQGVHELLRQGYGQEAEGKHRKKPHAKIGGQWQDIDPASWPERTGLVVGIGSAGREHDMAVMQQIMETQAEMLGAGLGGVLVKPENIYAAAMRFAEVADVRSPERFFSDPAQQQPQPPKPDPEMVKAEQEIKLEQAKAKAALQIKQEDNKAKREADAEKAYYDHQAALARLEQEGSLKLTQMEQEMALKERQLVAELDLKRELGLANAAVSREVGHAKVAASTSTSNVEMGGEPG